MSEDPEAQSFCMAYGEGQTLQFQLRPSSIVLQHTGPAPVENLTKTVRRALAAPLDFPPLAQAVIPDDRIVIAAEPDTPGLPLIMRELWTVFAGQGVRPEHLTIVQTQSRSDPRELLPEDVRSEVQWLQHSPQDQGSLAYLASTTGGDRIQLARSLTEADVTISVGRLGFDPILGYRGTNSAFYPALSDFDAIDKARGQGHAELQPEDSRPLRQIVDEVGWLLGTQFTLQVVPAADGDVAAVLAGAVEPVFRRGREFLSKQLLLELDERADLVVVSVGTDAGGHGWTQIAAAIASAQNLVTRDGQIVVLSQLAEACGPGLELLRQADAPADVIKPLGLEPPADVIPATQIAGAVQRARVYLLSQLPNETVEDLFMEPVTPEDVVRIIEGGADRVALISEAQNVHCRIR